ncbi:hypothetical protein LCGC14_0406450 [marine sediment metagenome]|uniref:Uncharacterized protein n=1 Tax=marine sediment metagenome TaxID=412755 RepID=A0A0F9VHF4_9ZZZZ
MDKILLEIIARYLIRHSKNYHSNGEWVDITLKKQDIEDMLIGKMPRDKEDNIC